MDCIGLTLFIPVLADDRGVVRCQVPRLPRLPGHDLGLDSAAAGWTGEDDP